MIMILNDSIEKRLEEGMRMLADILLQDPEIQKDLRELGVIDD